MKSFLNWKLIFILTAVCLVYSGILGNGLVWDDETFIKNWPERRDLVGNFADFWKGGVAPRQEGVYRPVRSVLYGLSYYAFGENPVPYHGSAILMHLVAVILVYLIAKKITNEKTALLASLIFGAHPINVEAVAWITASFDSAGVLFALIGIYAYLNSKNRWWMIVSIFFALAAFFTNEVTLVLPALLIILDWHQKILTQKNWKRVWINYLPHFMGAGGFLAVRMLWLGIVARQEYMYGNILVSMLVGMRALVEFARSFLIPINLGPIHSLGGDVTSFFYHDFNFEKPFKVPSLSDVWILLSLILVVMVVLWVIKNREKNRTVSMALLWFGVALLPVMQLVPQSIIFAEGEAYLASVGASIGLAYLMVKYLNIFWVRGLVVGVVVGLMTISWGQTKIWKNEETLWNRAMNIYDKSTLVHTNLGKYYFENGDQGLGLEYLDKAVELNDNNVLALTNLGVAYAQTGDSQKGVAYLEKANKLQPGYFASQQNLALVYIDSNRGEDARKLLQEMIETNTSDVWAYLQMAKSFHKQFIFNQAENYYLKVLEMEPKNLDALNNLGNLYRQWGRIDEAKTTYEKVLEIDGEYGDVREKMNR